MAEHLVQFYDNEAFLVDEIWSFINPCQQLGQTAIIIATKTRIDSLEQKFSPVTLTGEGPCKSDTVPYIMLDAETTLSLFMVDGWPNETRFKTVIGEVIRKATKEGRQHVRAYGEMVALLCAQGKPDAAIRLEELWADLQQKYPFSLLCGYPMGVFTKQEHSQSFEAICRAHTHVRPVENHPASIRDDEYHLAVAMLRQKTHALESEVTRRMEIEEELNRKLEELAEVDQRKDEFLAMLGHELRNPLAPIMNSLQLMRLQGNDMQQITRSRETIERQIALMTRLVDDLLDVSRITRGKIELKLERLTLDHIIECAVEIAHPLIDERHHHLTLNLPGDPVYLLGDCVRLAQVLANLLHNAAKYTDPGGRISLGACTQENNLVLTVSDNGIGLGKHLQEKVFDLFVQDIASLSKARGGLGLGLTLARSLVQLHGGSVEAHSKGYGHGSDFIVRLPLHMESAAPLHQPPIMDPDEQYTNSRKVLIVDDNVDAAESLGEFLKASGHSIQVAHDSATAISEATRMRPEVIILDIGMPNMDGYQIAQYLRSEVGLTSSLLVAVTGYAQERDRLFATKAGFDHHFAKPLDIRKLAAVLNDT